ncbi:helix-turn-helix domain-containing protein [Streptomyces sp. WMMC940]|uniref:helix-turn-helix domain-containing protein n=1 Tax=Streptomyces sp. WMMC940 TaxID=3015153 RepID=UPI0022B6D413|nr:helix-turn-helix domain-containing protein [Streptomyces sp. WMMC940]MCZ7459748.1 helix-turn-helix domain-containing protein [Streptomyces sp. WMMC940]
MTTTVIEGKWYTTAEVAEMLGFGLSKTKMLVLTGEIRSLKEGRSRRILPRWVDEYVERRAREAQEGLTA